MDILTHAVMGAAFAAGVASIRYRGEKSGLAARRLAAGIGAAAGLLPDADALIQSGGDALLVLDYHRHFSHALAFVPIGALIAALLLWPLLRRRIDFATLYLCALAGYLPHPLLDACTSYGTHLWLPFSQRREAWNLIAVVDPLFTLLLAVPLFLYLRRPDSRALRWGLLLGPATSASASSSSSAARRRRWRWRRRAGIRRRSCRSSPRWPTWCCGVRCTCMTGGCRSMPSTWPDAAPLSRCLGAAARCRRRAADRRRRGEAPA